MYESVTEEEEGKMTNMRIIREATKKNESKREEKLRK